MTPTSSSPAPAAAARPQLEYFAPDQLDALRARTLMTRADLSLAIRSGRLKALDQHPRRGSGYSTATLSQLAAETRNSLARAAVKRDGSVDAASQLALMSTIVARVNARDEPTRTDIETARVWLRASPKDRPGMARALLSLNGARLNMRMHAGGPRSSFYDPSTGKDV